MPPGVGYPDIASIIAQMRGQLGYSGSPAISRLTGPPARGRMAQGRNVVERDGRQGVMGRGGNFQELGSAALGRLAHPGAGLGGGVGGGRGIRLDPWGSGGPMDPAQFSTPLTPMPSPPVTPPVEPISTMGIGGSEGGPVGGLADASMEKPLFGPRGSGPVPPGAPPNPASRIPFPPTGGGMTPVGPGAAPNVGGLAGSPSMPSRGMGDKLSSMTGGGLIGGTAGPGTMMNPDIAARRMQLNNRMRSLMLPATAVASSMAR